MGLFRVYALTLGAALTIFSPAQAQLPVAYDVYEVTASSLRLRTEPSTESEITRSLRKGTTVLIVKREGEWARVYANGKPAFGWVHSAYLKGPDD